MFGASAPTGRQSRAWPACTNRNMLHHPQLGDHASPRLGATAAQLSSGTPRPEARLVFCLRMPRRHERRSASPLVSTVTGLNATNATSWTECMLSASTAEITVGIAAAHHWIRGRGAAAGLSGRRCITGSGHSCAIGGRWITRRPASSGIGYGRWLGYRGDLQPGVADRYETSRRHSGRQCPVSRRPSIVVPLVEPRSSASTVCIPTCRLRCRRDSSGSFSVISASSPRPITWRPRCRGTMCPQSGPAMTFSNSAEPSAFRFSARAAARHHAPGSQAWTAELRLGPQQPAVA